MYHISACIPDRIATMEVKESVTESDRRDENSNWNIYS